MIRIIFVCFFELSICQIINANFDCNVGDTSCSDLLDLPLEPESNTELKPELKPGLNSRPLASKLDEKFSNGMSHNKKLVSKDVESDAGTFDACKNIVVSCSATLRLETAFSS